MGSDPPNTGMLSVVRKPAEDEDATYVLLPILDGSELDHMAVFADGSYVRWVPGAY